MKTFIPHVYFSAPEDTVGDLVNQIRRESEIPGTAEPKPEMKDSGKKSIIPKTVVSAPEKDTVGDLIEQLHKEPEAIPEEKPEEKTEQPEKTEGKKSIIPKTVVSAAKSELDRVYDLLTSGEDLQMNPDGTLSPASARKARAGQRAESAGEDEKGDHSAHGGLRARKGHRGRPYRAAAQGA